MFTRYATSTLTLLFLLTPGLAWAQEPARSFAQLQSRIKIGNKVRVIDARGNETRGKVANVSAASIGVIDSGTIHSFLEAEVRKVSRQRGMSLGRGALYGAAGGTLLMFANCGDFSDERCSGVAVAVVGFYAGLGAGAGVGIAAITRRTETVFEVSNSVSLEVVPSINRWQKGVTVSFSFK